MFRLQFFILVAFTLCFHPRSAFSQAHFVSNDYSQYYNWLHQRSQTASLYQSGTTLYTFAKVTIRTSPCIDSDIAAHLAAGYPLTNIAYELDEELPEDEILGYTDMWFHVSGTATDGSTFTGYIWGAFIAKSWQNTQLDNGSLALVMMGMPNKKRNGDRDIYAVLKIVQGGNIISSENIPGFCVFEECDNSLLLRVLNNQPAQGAKIIEVSSMTIGCVASVEKSYFLLTGTQMERVYHANFTKERELRNKSFTFKNKQGTIYCRYSHEDKNYMPVWDSKIIKPAENNNDKAITGFKKA